MELLIAMGIIVILLSMGTLAFNTLTGNRSVGMAQSQVAGMLAKARSLAMNDTSSNGAGPIPYTYGVAFFYDPGLDRTSMAIIRRDPNGNGDPDPYDNYKGWAPGVYYQIGDRVVAMVMDTTNGKPQVRRFRCLVTHTSTARGLAGNPLMSVTAALANGGNWEEVIDGGLIVLDEPVEVLPAGVAVQTLVDATVAASTTNIDRYLRTGLILFDRMGRLEHLTYIIDRHSAPGMKMGLNKDMGPDYVPPTGGKYTLYSQFGLVIYETAAYKGLGYTEGDYLFDINQGSLNPPASWGDEQTKENWIDQNSTFFIVNRYSGELNKVR